jgi:hypothetical protein
MDIPNIFGGGMPSYIPGLLGQEETAALQKRANVQGLLGAALSLAQGMSPMGPRRSAAQNILGAIAGGLQAGQGAYQGAVQNYMTQQQLANAQLQQQKNLIDLQRQNQTIQAVEQVIQSPEIANNPAMVAYFRANPDKALERQLNMQMAREARGMTQPQSAPQTAPQVSAQAMPQGVRAELPSVDVSARIIPYQNNIQQAENAANFYAAMGTKEGADMSAKFRDEANYFRGLQRQEELVGGVSESLANVDPTLRRRAESLIVNAPSLTQEQIQSRLDAILADDANLKQQLDPRLSEQRIRERRAGAPNITIGDKVLQGERAKAQSRAEESAISAQNAASDVSAIIDILRPYRGGALQDFAGSIGAYLPGTELEKLATAKQAAEAIRAKLAPTLRVEGSGATSDFEIKSFLSAIPSLFNTTEGRDLMATYAQRLADRSVAAADIRARLTEEGRYSIKNFQEELRKAGLDRVFSNEDIQRLRGKAPVAGGLSPEGQKAFEKYRPRQP